MSSNTLFTLISLSLLLHQTNSYGEDCSSNDQDCLNYANALKLAKYPSQSREVTSLNPLRIGSSKLRFDSQNRVLLTRVDVFKYWNYTKGDTVTTVREGWYTAYPDLRNACKNFKEADKAKRIKQLLGLPPNKVFDGVIEVYVPMSAIFRPCPDPEIYDKGCVAEIPVENKDSANPDAPWYCPANGEEVVQIGENWEDVKNEHFQWMCRTWGYNYGNEGTYNNYPWTGLGYTFDWGSQSGIGLSEFIVALGTEVGFVRKVSIEEYCKK